MSVDDRLRIGLSRNACSLDPDVELLLVSARAMHRRSRWLRRGAAAAGLVAAACAAGAVVWSGWAGDHQPPVVPATSTSPSIVLHGRYAGQVAALPSAPTIAGRWMLDFGSAGMLGVTAPATYPGVVSGSLFAVRGRELRTDLFSQDACSGQPVGQYSVSRTGPRLTLVVVDDPCSARVGVLATTTWTSSP